MKSDVYFVKVETSDTQQRISGLKKLLEVTNPFSEYKKDEFIPIKLTIGEPACVYNISPELVKIVVSEIKSKETKPFLFDTCVIYKGQRHNAVDYLALAQNKGFGYSKVGAPFIIADGLLGQDGKEFAINSRHINKVKAPSFIGMLESLVVLSHATGHMVSAYAGAIKNVAMGMVCRPTKQVQHSSLKPKVIEKKCTACGCCIAICPASAISLKNNKAFIDQKICLGCGECLCACKFDAIYINWEEVPAIFCKRMDEVANAILSKFKNKFFINFAFDITQECDCISTKDDRIISADLGLLASRDIVSLDKATVDLALEDKKSDFLNRKKDVYFDMLEYARDLGMGSLEYNLVNL
jgi:uncharacterized Fe-S center protein